MVEVNDKSIESKVKIELRLNNIGGDDLVVRACDGRVLLEGTVDSQRKAEQANRVCMTISGVLTVDNHLEVKQ